VEAISQSKENAKEQIDVLCKRCQETRWTSTREKDTITKLIHPMLKALGWNILDLNEMQEEVFAQPGGKDRHIDLVLYLQGKPYIGMEIKGLSKGPINQESKEAVQYWIQNLLEKSRYLNVKYAVLTRFIETLIFDPKSSKKLASFNYLYEYDEKFDDLWEYLSKPR